MFIVSRRALAQVAKPISVVEGNDHYIWDYENKVDLESSCPSRVVCEQGRYDLWFWFAYKYDGSFFAWGGGQETKDECVAQATEIFPYAAIE